MKPNYEIVCKWLLYRTFFSFLYEFMPDSSENTKVIAFTLVFLAARIVCDITVFKMIVFPTKPEKNGNINN